MNIHANPGDTIEITHPTYKTGEMFVVIDRPSCSKGGESPGDVWIILPNGPGWLKQKHYKIVKLANDTDYAQPGDTIEIDIPMYSGQQLVVIKCPNGASLNPTGCAWHENVNGGPSFAREGVYRVVKRKNKSVSTPNIVGDTPVDLEKSLRQKRDALLRGWFT